jgi:hypothetical protein
VRDPVCCGCGCGYGCDSRGAREDLVQALRGAKRLDLGARLWYVVLVKVEELLQVGEWRGGQQRGVRQRAVAQSDV